MGVIITSPGAGAGGASVAFSYFADSFARVDQPFCIGTNWFTCGLTPNENVSQTGVQMAALLNVSGGTDFVVTNAGGPAPCPTMQCIPARINPGPLFGKKQFAEIAVISGTNAVNTVSGGPAVFWDSNSGSGYVCAILNNAAIPHYRVERWVNGVVGAVIIAFRDIAYGNTVRIEVVPGTPHTITVFVNGVQTDTVTDAGVAAVGVPCWIGNATVGTNMHFRNFKCGSLPQMRTAADFTQ
jgi:hypothetical protein